MMAFYNTHLALGFILHRRGPHECENTKKTAQELQTVYTLEMTLFNVCRIILNALSVMTVCQCRHKLHRTVSLSWINVLSCIPCTSPAAVERSYYIPSWHRKLATVSRHSFLALLLLSPEIKNIRLASKIITS